MCLGERAHGVMKETERIRKRAWKGRTRRKKKWVSTESVEAPEAEKEPQDLAPANPHLGVLQGCPYRSDPLPAPLACWPQGQTPAGACTVSPGPRLSPRLSGGVGDRPSNWPPNTGGSFPSTCPGTLAALMSAL